MTEKRYHLNTESRKEPNNERNRLAFDTVEFRFSRWLVSNRLAACPNSDDGMDAICPSMLEQDCGQTKEDEKQRKLLDVEQARVERVKQEEQATQDLIQEVSRIYNKAMIERVTEKLKDGVYTVNETLRLPRVTNDLITMLFSPSAAFRRIGGLIQADKELTTSVMTLINSSNFAKYIGKDFGKNNDPSSAVGKLGIPGSQYIIPLMMLKPKVPMNHGVRSTIIEKKLWTWVLYCVNCTRMMLRKAGYNGEKELEGVILGTIRVMGYIAIYREFCRVASDVKYDCLSALKHKRKLYDAMVDIEPNFNVLPQLFRDIGASVTFNIAEQFTWESLPHVLKALQEDHEKIPIEKRSTHGAVYGQMEAYVMFDMLRKAKMIKKDEIMPCLHYVHMSNRLIKDLLPLEMGTLDFREYIG